jgi:hypothetical protein
MGWDEYLSLVQQNREKGESEVRGETTSLVSDNRTQKG